MVRLILSTDTNCKGVRQIFVDNFLQQTQMCRSSLPVHTINVPNASGRKMAPFPLSTFPAKIALVLTRKYFLCENKKTKHDQLNSSHFVCKNVCLSVDVTQAFLEACKHGTCPSYRARINIIGHSGAGKTSLTRRLLGQKFQKEEESTDGIETHRIEFDLKKGDKSSWRERELNTETLMESFKQEFQLRQKDLNAGKEPMTLQLLHQSQAAVRVSPELKGSPREQTTHQTAVATENFPSGLKLFEPPKLSQKDLKEIEGLQEGTGLSATFSRILKKLGNSQDQAKAVLSLWDFGGQTEFYTTHHMFLDADAINIIVMDISKPLKEKMCKDNDKVQLVGVPQTPEEFLCYWLRSIQAKAEEKKIDPNILLVLTHKDTISGSQSSSYIQDDFMNSILQLISQANLPLVGSQNIFVVDNNTGDKREFDSIKSYFLQSMEKLEWQSERPVRWLKLEADMRAKSFKCLAHADVIKLAEKLLINEEELEVFLMFLHSKGDIIWFPDSGLKHLIVLEPQWLVNMFKKLITAEQFLHKQPFRDEALQLLQHGTVTFTALKKFWAGHDVYFLAKLLQNFGLILPLEKSSAAFPQKYLVPCMLPQKEVAFMQSEPFKGGELVYESKHLAVFDQLFPIGTMAKLMSVCHKRWQMRQQELSHRLVLHIFLVVGIPCITLLV